MSIIINFNRENNVTFTGIEHRAFEFLRNQFTTKYGKVNYNRLYNYLTSPDSKFTINYIKPESINFDELPDNLTIKDIKKLKADYNNRLKEYKTFSTAHYVNATHLFYKFFIELLNKMLENDNPNLTFTQRDIVIRLAKHMTENPHDFINFLNNTEDVYLNINKYIREMNH